MKLAEQYADRVDAFIRVCHRLDARGFVTSQGGNLAWKLADDLILITATCLAKGEHTREDVVFINAAGETVEGNRRPTGEIPLYLALFRARPDVESVIHCHPPACCAVSILDGENPLLLPTFPEVILEIGPVPLAPYARPLTEELAGNVAPLLKKHNAVLMENHGVIMVSPRALNWTMGLMEELESAAEALLKAKAVGPIKTISKQRLIEMDDIMRIRSLPRVGEPGANPSLVEMYYPEASGEEAR